MQARITTVDGWDPDWGEQPDPEGLHEFKDLDELLAFVKKVGTCVIEPPDFVEYWTVVVYNGYIS